MWFRADCSCCCCCEFVVSRPWMLMFALWHSISACFSCVWEGQGNKRISCCQLQFLNLWGVGAYRDPPGHGGPPLRAVQGAWLGFACACLGGWVLGW